jgi:hypothetical protein
LNLTESQRRWHYQLNVGQGSSFIAEPEAGLRAASNGEVAWRSSESVVLVEKWKAKAVATGSGK